MTPAIEIALNIHRYYISDEDRETLLKALGYEKPLD